MNDLTLLCVNWNQQPCIELLLKSYVQHHYVDEPLKLLLVDNGSKDGSKEWLNLSNIPFVDLHNNIGHENAINLVYDDIKTKYCLLVDSDVEFLGNVFGYLDYFKDGCISAGELIDKNFINQIKIKDRISPWFWLFDISKMKKAIVKTFRTKEDWTYDVGSEYWEKMRDAGFTNHNIERIAGDQDGDLISMRYQKFNHIGKTSWDIYGKHQDRIGEVERRRNYVLQKLNYYKEVDLTDKFI